MVGPRQGQRGVETELDVVPHQDEALHFEQRLAQWRRLAEREGAVGRGDPRQDLPVVVQGEVEVRIGGANPGACVHVGCHETSLQTSVARSSTGRTPPSSIQSIRRPVTSG